MKYIRNCYELPYLTLKHGPNLRIACHALVGCLEKFPLVNEALLKVRTALVWWMSIMKM